MNTTMLHRLRHTSCCLALLLLSLASIPAFAAATPVCTLHTDTSVIAQGELVILSPICTESPTSYVWTGGSCTLDTSEICFDFPDVTTTYSVAGINSAGRGNSVAVTVKVNSPATAAPVCTLEANPSTTVVSGDSITLTAMCTQSPTSYKWTGSGCESVTGASCTALPTANTTFTVTGSNSKGTSNVSSLDVTLGTPPPPNNSCTLSASPSTPIAPGTEVTLSASCIPTAMSYNWSGTGCYTKNSSCTVYPTATSSYSVTGNYSNVSFTGTPGTVTVTVNAATAAPVCTLASYGGTTFMPGDEVRLTTNCTPAATSWVWTGGGCAGKNTQSCSDYPTVATTYTVIASNDKGSDSKRTISVTPSGTTPPPSTPTISCSLSASPSTPIAPGTAVTLTASCSPAATSYVWTGGSCAVNTSSCTVTPATTTIYSVTGRNASATATPKTVTVTVNALATTAPVCTLTSYDGGTTFVLNNGVVLNAKCTPAATSYVWTGGKCADTAKDKASCSDTPTGATTYTVVASNSKGSDSPRSLTMTPDTTTPSSLCSLTATPSSVAVGDSYTLTGQCGSSVVTSAKWSGEGCSAETGPSCTVKSTKAGTFAYSVALTLQAGVTSVGGVPLMATTTVTVTAAAAAASYQGLWWNPNESGWGISLTQHSDKVFAAIYTYDAAGQPTWYALSDCPIKADKPGSCTGDIYKVTGGSTPLVPWAGSVKPESEGTGTFTFNDASHGQFDYTFKDGVKRSKTIEKLTFAIGTTPFAVNYTDLWWSEGENGWGVALTQDQGMIFAAWYAYDDQGNPVWYTVSSCPLTGSTASGSCTGNLYRVTGGSPLTIPWAASKLSLTDIGLVNFQFSDKDQADMTYSIDGKLSSRKITRFSF
jgi:hypothetical protein